MGGRDVPLFPFLSLVSAGTSLGLTGGSSRAALGWRRQQQQFLVSASIVFVCAWEEYSGKPCHECCWASKGGTGRNRMMMMVDSGRE